MIKTTSDSTGALNGSLSQIQSASIGNQPNSSAAFNDNQQNPKDTSILKTRQSI
jgi:hypothetical protein